MPRYRSRSAAAKVASPGPLDAPVIRVDFVDGYQPSVDDSDLLQVWQGARIASWMNEIGYWRAQAVPGHNSDDLLRFVETVVASGKAIAIDNEARTTKVWTVDQHDGHVERFLQTMTDLKAVGPTDGRHADIPAGVAMMASSQFAMVPPEIYGVRLMTIDPNLCPTARAVNSQELAAAKVFCAADMTLTTMSCRVRTAATTLAAGYNGFAIYSDGATMNLLGSTPDDTALFTSIGQRAKNLTTPVNLVAGNFYWIALLANISAGTLAVAGATTSGEPGVTNSWPAGNTTALLAGQTSFPASITKTSMVGNGSRLVVAGY